MNQLTDDRSLQSGVIGENFECACFLACKSVHGYYYYCTQSEFWLDPCAAELDKTEMGSQVFYCSGGAGWQTVVFLCAFLEP